VEPETLSDEDHQRAVTRTARREPPVRLEPRVAPSLYLVGLGSLAALGLLVALVVAMAE
jgi:hypothetical protein